MARKTGKREVAAVRVRASQDDVRAALKNFVNLKADAKEASGSFGGEVKAWVERYSYNKKAVAFAIALAGTEDIKRTTIIDDFLDLVIKAGYLDQASMFDDVRARVEAGSKAAKAKRAEAPAVGSADLSGMLGGETQGTA